MTHFLEFIRIIPWVFTCLVYLICFHSHTNSIIWRIQIMTIFFFVRNLLLWWSQFYVWVLKCDVVLSYLLYTKLVWVDNHRLYTVSKLALALLTFFSCLGHNYCLCVSLQIFTAVTIHWTACSCHISQRT